MQNADLLNELELQRWQVARMQVELTAVQSENRRLRRMTDNGQAGRILHRANNDARQLVGWRFANYSISRRLALTYGMPERRWMWGIAVLRLAGIIPQAGSVDDFEVDAMPDCLAAIDRATRKCEINGLGPLVFRMARGRVQTPKR